MSNVYNNMVVLRIVTQGWIYNCSAERIYSISVYVLHFAFDLQGKETYIFRSDMFVTGQNMKAGMTRIMGSQAFRFRPTDSLAPPPAIRSQTPRHQTNWPSRQHNKVGT